MVHDHDHMHGMNNQSTGEMMHPHKMMMMHMTSSGAKTPRSSSLVGQEQQPECMS